MNTYPIDNLWRKGHYMMRLAENGRDFVQGKTIKSRHTVEVSPADIGTLPGMDPQNLEPAQLRRMWPAQATNRAYRRHRAWMGTSRRPR